MNTLTLTLAVALTVGSPAFAQNVVRTTYTDIDGFSHTLTTSQAPLEAFEETRARHADTLAGWQALAPPIDGDGTLVAGHISGGGSIPGKRGGAGGGGEIPRTFLKGGEGGGGGSIPWLGCGGGQDTDPVGRNGDGVPVLPGELLEVGFDEHGRPRLVSLARYEATFVPMRGGEAEIRAISEVVVVTADDGSFAKGGAVLYLLGESGPPSTPPPPGYMWVKVNAPPWLSGRGSCWKAVLI